LEVMKYKLKNNNFTKIDNQQSAAFSLQNNQMQTKRIVVLGARVSCIFLFTLSQSTATEMVYTPVNPSFGGNANNGVVLLSGAQAQNGHKDPSIKLTVALTDLQQFNQSLQRSVLSRLSSAATTSLIGTSGQLIPGSIDTGNYHIVISDLGLGMLQVSTTDKVTGENVSFQVESK
jgi:curli production assembly/transport component CsgF